MKIKTTPRETAEYFLGAYIVEDDIYTEQSGADDGMMMQRNVAYYCLTEPEGNQDDLPEEGIGKYGRLGLEPLGTLEGEREYTYDYRFTIPTHEPIDHNLDNCRLVYFICKADATIEPTVTSARMPPPAGSANRRSTSSNRYTANNPPEQEETVSAGPNGPGTHRFLYKSCRSSGITDS